MIAAAILTVLRNAARPERLPHADLCYRSDCHNDSLPSSPKLVAWRKEVAEKITEKFPILKLNKFLKDKSKKEAA